jgi:hypothetical protein
MGLYRTLILGLLLVGCAEQSTRPECDKEYSTSIMHCGQPKRREATPAECTAAGGIQVWEGWGTQKIYRGCTRSWPP